MKCYKIYLIFTFFTKFKKFDFQQPQQLFVSDDNSEPKVRLSSTFSDSVCTKFSIDEHALFATFRYNFESLPLRCALYCVVRIIVRIVVRCILSSIDCLWL